jgi:hypothetical protein
MSTNSQQISLYNSRAPNASEHPHHTLYHNVLTERGKAYSTAMSQLYGSPSAPVTAPTVAWLAQEMYDALYTAASAYREHSETGVPLSEESETVVRGLQNRGFVSCVAGSEIPKTDKTVSRLVECESGS